MSSSRLAPTTPNSPREIALGEEAWKLPIQTEMASKSKVRQTLTFFAITFFGIGSSLRHLYCDDIQGVQRPHVAIPISTDAPASAPLALLANAPSLYVRSAGAAVI